MKKSLYLFFLIPVLFCCTERIDIRTDDSEPVIVIYGVLTDENKYQEIRISRSAPYFDDEPNRPISNAWVAVTSSEQEVIEFNENKAREGYYYSEVPFRIKEGIDYHLNVKVDFDGDGIPEAYEAFTSVSNPVYLDSVKVEPIRIMGHNNYSINIYGQDSPEEEYYLFKFLVNDSSVTNKISQYGYTDDIMFNGQYIDGLSVQYFDDISEKENDSEERQKQSVYLNEGDIVTVAISVINKDYFNFIYQCQKEMSGENPMFGGPASNIISNISNGGVGFFTGYCVARSDAVVPGIQ